MAKVRETPLAEDADHVRAMLDSALDAIITFDHEGRVLEFNRAAQAMLGYTREDALGEMLHSLICPVTLRETHRDVLGQLLCDGQSPVLGQRVETRAVRADGTEFPVELTVTRSNTTDPPLFTAYLRDITERDNAEEALRQSQRTLMTLLGNLPGMAHRCREADHRTMEFASQGCFDLTGYEQAELLGDPDRSYYGLIDPEDRPRIQAELREAIAERSLFQLSYRIRTASGQEKWVAERGHGLYSVFSAENEVLAIEGFILDVTDQKRAETLLQDYNRTLVDEVAEHTKELHAKNAALEETLDTLKTMQNHLVMQAKMASLGAVTAGIAHEIKNPLNFVNNFAALSMERAEELREELAAQKDAIDPESYANLLELVGDIAQNAEKIHSHGKRADGIMSSMLDHSRAKPGDRREADLNALLEENATLAYHGWRARDAAFSLTIEKELDPGVGQMRVVPQELGRVFLNIIDNACHAALEKQKVGEEGFAPTILLRTRDLGQAVEVRIRDNGNGIPPENMEHIFTPFFTTKPRGVGTGLGLSISYDIVVQEHNGKLEVDTQLGKYAEFIITLPRGS